MASESLGTWEKTLLGYPVVLLPRTLRGTSGPELALAGQGLRAVWWLLVVM